MRLLQYKLYFTNPSKSVLMSMAFLYALWLSFHLPRFAIQSSCTTKGGQVGLKQLLADQLHFAFKSFRNKCLLTHL